MRASYFLKNLKLVERNNQWLRSSLPLAEKLEYYPLIALSYAEMLAGKKKIRYLGRDFYFDNPATPLNLQTYPYEISKKLLSNMDHLPKTILSVGGNIGQFARTIGYFSSGKAHIDIFEPNPAIFPLLKKNMQGYSHAHAFNYGVSSRDTEAKLFFARNHSGQGSVISGNCGDYPTTEVNISLTSHPMTLTGREKYDLVKIDVEGSEIEVIGGLKGIKSRYVYIEVSGPARQKSYITSELYREVATVLGEFETVYSGGSNKEAFDYEVLLKISPSSLRSSHKSDSSKPLASRQNDLYN